MNSKVALISIIIILFSNCQSTKKENKIIIFHAGSLSVPFKQIAKAFEYKYPGVKVELESAGSRTCARKISDLNKPCDIMVSADYRVIDNLLIPDFASWNYKFASNEIVIAYNENSLYNDKINSINWIDILSSPDVNYGRSNPDSDPCGYRTIIVVKLAEKYYGKPDIADDILYKNRGFIRPKAVDLLALLETQVIDYFFTYRSVAEQHGISYIELPDSINLENKQLSGYYKTASVKVSGKKPGDFIVHEGEPIIYGITQINSAPNSELAKKFLHFFFIDSVGISIMEENGQASIGLPFNIDDF